MKLRKVYIQELSFHTPDSLARELGISTAKTAECIEALTTRGVLKLRASEESKDYDLDHDGPIKGCYQFVYVGLVIFEEIAIIVFPKYMDPLAFSERDISEITLNDLRQVFQVIRKSSGGYSRIAAVSEEGLKKNDRLALMLALMESYGENGIYSNYVRVSKKNGHGSISWERTISQHSPFIANGVPVYFDYETTETAQDLGNFITRLHSCVLTRCSDFMQESGLAELLALDEIELSNDDVSDLGEIEFINHRLDLEQAAQFVTWKQDVLELLKRFVNEDDTLVKSDEVICLGTSSFYHVWESACKVAFSDRLETPLGKLGVALRGKWKQRTGDTLLEIIPSPKWYKNTPAGYESSGPVKTLIPDIVTLGVHDREPARFGILDAKYYTPELGLVTRGVPGVESITKQMLYQSAYRDFIETIGFQKTINAFIAPTVDSVPALRGYVEFPGVFQAEKTPFSNGVKLYCVPARDVFDSYLRSEKCDLLINYVMAEKEG